MHHKNPIKSFLFLLFIFSFLVLSFQAGAATKEVKAPDFTLPDLSGKAVSLNQYLGKVVVLDFWATWCPPCRMSIPELVKLQDKYREKGLIILGVSVDDPDTKDAYLTAFREKYKINYAILRVDDKTIEKYFGRSEVSIPTLFIINQKGMVVDMFSGYSPGAVEKSLEKILK
jgi:cytochrome c biogenesis protein CcmG, thiol:disulfide interchange protein DsbE